MVSIMSSLYGLYRAGRHAAARTMSETSVVVPCAENIASLVLYAWLYIAHDRMTA